MIHESREVTVRESRKPRQDSSIEIKVPKKRVDEFGEAGGVIGTEASYPEKTYETNENQFSSVCWATVNCLRRCWCRPPTTRTQGFVWNPVSRQQFALELVSMNILLRITDGQKKRNLGKLLLNRA